MQEPTTSLVVLANNDSDLRLVPGLLMLALNERASKRKRTEALNALSRMQTLGHLTVEYTVARPMEDQDEDGESGDDPEG